MGVRPATFTAMLVQATYTANTSIAVKVAGLTPNAKHGFSIREGDSTYNPFAKRHGAPSGTERKVGDLGNVSTNEAGEAHASISDPYVKLSGPFSVLGKLAAIHEHPDDLGYGRQEYSTVTGGVGGVIASGIIDKL